MMICSRIEKLSKLHCLFYFSIYQLVDQFDQPIWSTLCRLCDRRHIVAQMAGDEVLPDFLL